MHTLSGFFFVFGPCKIMQMKPVFPQDLLCVGEVNDSLGKRSRRRADTHLETPRAVISAGCALSFRSKAVCIVSLLLNTS